MTNFPEAELVLAGVLQQISEHDTDYPTRYGLVLDAYARARQLGYPVGIDWDADPTPDLDGYRIVVRIVLPTGQVAWHMPEDRMTRDGYAVDRTIEWDGHSPADKHERIRAYGKGADVDTDPTGLRALIGELETAIAAARAGDRTAYATARTAAQAVETRARAVDVELHGETFQIAEGEMRAADQARRGGR